MSFFNEIGVKLFTSLLKTYIGIPLHIYDDNDGKIDNNDNLNNYDTIGNYSCTSSSVASTLSNSPTQNPFTLKVYSPNKDGGSLIQCVEDQDNAVWRRYKTSSSSSWSSWCRFPIIESDTVGSSTKPVYLSSGKFTASSSTVGSGTKPIYLSSGTITASSSTVGSSNTPVYLNSGTLTACSSSSGDLSVSSSSFNTCGYVKFSNGFIIQWGNKNTTAGTESDGYYTVTFPTSFTSKDSYVIMKNGRSSSGGKLYVNESCFYYDDNRTARRARTRIYDSSTTNEQWLAVGY